MYDANTLNQYTSIAENRGTPFIPQFDSDGNQTLIKTETGIWSAVYNAENRPITFTNTDSGTVVECSYDSMGRRAYKKVTVNGSVTLHQRYIYRGYLQIACSDLTRSYHPDLWYITWDPTQSPRGLGGGLDKPQSEFAPHGVSRQWGAGESTRRHPSAGHSNQRHLVHLRLGSHQEHL